MAYNNYGNYGYGYPQYNANMGYQNFQQPTMQNPMLQNQIIQPQTQNREIPFSESHYGTMKEAEAYIVPPMKSVLFMNKANNEIYVKSADNMGNPSFETYKKTGIEENPVESKYPTFDTEMFVKKEDLENKDFVNKETFDNVLKKINDGINKELKQIREMISIQKSLNEDKKGV